MANRPSTPPPAPQSSAQKPPLTPEQVRRIEENRLKAKALRNQNERQTHNSTLVSNAYIKGQKRPYAATLSTPSDRTVRDARQQPPSNSTTNEATDINAPHRPHDDILPARRMKKYIDYDFSVMKDTKGGFLSLDDDPHNRALHSGSKPGDQDADRPTHMTSAEWERHQLLKKLRASKSGPFEPGISGLRNGVDSDGKKVDRTCAECESLEVDWNWLDIFGIRVCNPCKERLPDKYSLLTKSEAREDYLLTDPELKDTDLLPRLEKPNPHKSTWHSMQLYLRCQVEAYAFSERKWGSEAGLDAEFARRTGEKKKRREDKFQSRLADLKRKTRAEAFARRKAGGGGGGRGEFGERVVGRGEGHEHVWGGAVISGEGVSAKRCVECEMEVEELEF